MIEDDDQMTKADEIFERHVGLNAELGYIPIERKDVVDAINEALVTGRKELLIAFKTWEIKTDTENLFPEQLVDFYLDEVSGSDTP